LTYTKKKLWHQLTDALLSFYQHPDAQPYLVGVFNEFVGEFWNKLDALKVVELAVAASSTLPDRHQAIQFLRPVTAKLDKEDTRLAYIRSVMETADYHLALDDVQECHTAMEQCEVLLEALGAGQGAIGGIPVEIHASFYRVSANYYKCLAKYPELYKTALLYLGCVKLEDLPEEQRQDWARGLCVAAVLGDTIYNMGELLTHPVLDALHGTSDVWLADLVRVLHRGEHTPYDILATNFPKMPLFVTHQNFIRQKLCLMSLLALLTYSSIRRVPFSTISNAARLPVTEVEYLVMKALALEVMKGKMDQVEGVVEVAWVQPRYVELAEVDGMKQKLEEWMEKVDKVRVWMDGAAREVYVWV